MDILKLIKFIIIILLIINFSSCKKPRIKIIERNHKEIGIKNWNIKTAPIKTAFLFCYKKNTDFKTLEKKDSILSISDGYKNYNTTFLKFNSFSTILTNKDYKLIINDTIVYKIKNIETDIRVKRFGHQVIDSIHNMISSININDKKYKFDKPKGFFIPKDAYIIEK